MRKILIIKFSAMEMLLKVCLLLQLLKNCIKMDVK